MTTLKSFAILAAITLALAVASVAQPIAAQGIEIEWSPTINLSNSPTSSNRPAVAVDPAGNVHVVWGEDMGGESLLDSPGSLLGDANTLVYRRWDGSTWSEAVDIIALPDDPLAEYASLAADSRGYLHLVWTGLNRIYYSRAAASQAGSPHAWSKPVAIGSSARTSWESAVAVDAQGAVHILYADREVDPGVIHVNIANNGLGKMTWTRVSGSLVPPDEAAFAEVSLTIDPVGRLHALWSAVNARGYGHAAYYARSLDGGQTWSEPVLLAQGERNESNVEVASLGVAGDSELHAIYAYPANMGRTERISLDAGETWGEPRTIYEDLEGIAGFTVQLTDADGNLHAICNLRTHDQAGGLFYWRWLGDHWSPYQFASREDETTAPGGHFVAATIRLGNEIHAVWNNQGAELPGEIWHVSGVIPSVTAQAPVPLPTAEPLPNTPKPTAQPAAVSTAAATETLPAPTPPVQNVSGQAAATPSIVSTLLFSLAPALLLVLGVLVWRLARKR
jgi:hypothetical protein